MIRLLSHLGVYLGVGLLIPILSQASPLSDRLGFRSDEKVVILHIDDIGATAGANRAAAAGLKFGLARSGSVMMPGPAVRDVIAELGREQSPSALDLGVHLTLNSSGGLKFKPLAAASNVPSLVDAAGNFSTGLARLAVFGSDADVEQELDTQIQAALAMCERAGANVQFGDCLTHIDTHMATVFLRPSWAEIYLKLARRYKLVPMIPRWSTGLQQLIGLASTPAGWFVKPYLKSLEKRGFLLLDDFYLLPFPKAEQSYEARKAEYMTVLRNLKPGVTQIIVHPTFVDSTKPPRPADLARDIDAKILQDPDIANALRDVHLIGYRELKRVYPWDSLR